LTFRALGRNHIEWKSDPPKLLTVFPHFCVFSEHDTGR